MVIVLLEESLHGDSEVVLYHIVLSLDLTRRLHNFVRTDAAPESVVFWELASSQVLTVTFD